MSKSILHDEKQCIICGRTNNLHKHHIYGGVGRRELSEQYGCWCWLCADHHTGNHGVHFNHEMDLLLKRKTEKELIKRGMITEAFMRIFGRDYL